MKSLVLGLVILGFGDVGLAGSHCADALKNVKNIRYNKSLEVPTSAPARRAASTIEEEKAKKVNEFLDKQPFAQQKALAIALVNYLDAKVSGKNPDPAQISGIVDFSIPPSKVVASDPNSALQKIIAGWTAKDLTDMKGLSRYLLVAFDTKVSAKSVRDFLVSFGADKKDHFSILAEECFAGDPTTPFLLETLKKGS